MKPQEPSKLVPNPLPLIQQLSLIEDPRVERHKVYPLENIIMFAFVAILSDQQSWYQVVDFSEANLEWFSEFLDVSSGVPSHDTFRRVFGLLRPEVLQRVLSDWANFLRKDCGSNVKLIAIDGKSVRGVPWRQSDEELHTLNAFEPHLGLCLGQVGVNSKTNEIGAMPDLLSSLCLKGTVVTTDALLTQKSIAQQIRNQGGDYLLALKGNHGTLFKEAKLYFTELHTGMFSWRTLEKNRGFVEERSCLVSGCTHGWETLEEWPDLRRVLLVRSQRTRDGKTTTEERYYITSAELGAKPLLESVRAHWGIENKLHRTLDVLFLEDASQEHERTTAENLSTLRKMAVNVLNSMDPAKSLVSKRKRASYDAQYRRKLLLGKI